MNCFECGKYADNLHHVIPKSMGGTKTIPLCGICHGVVHSRKAISASALTKAALKAKRARGEQTGGSIPYGYDVGADGVHLKKNTKEQIVIVFMNSLRSSGLSLRAIAQELHKRNIPTKQGKTWEGSTVSRIIKRSRR